MDGERCEDSTSDQSHLVDLHSGDRVGRPVLITTRQILLSMPLNLRQKSFSDRQVRQPSCPFEILTSCRLDWSTERSVFRRELDFDDHRRQQLFLEALE